MSVSTRSSKNRRERRRLVTGLCVLGVAGIGITSLVTGAFFTDTQSIGSNTFTTGTVKLGLTPVTNAVSLPNMAPGDTVYGPITVSNTGSLALRYAMLSTSDATDANFLAAQLQMTVKTGIAAASCNAAGWSGGAVASPAAAFGSTTGTKVFGDAAVGFQTGDRTLAAAATEVLCVQVTLPFSTGNTYQNKTTTAVFRYDAEQTANN